LRPLRDRVMVKILLLVILVTMLLVTGCVQPATEVEELNRWRLRSPEKKLALVASAIFLPKEVGHGK